MADNTTLYCPYAREPFDLSPDLVVYREPQAISRIRNFAFRYGHTSNIDKVIVDKEESDEYLTGLLGTSLTILAFILAWMIMLLVLKCLGYERVGLFSGRTSNSSTSDCTATSPGRLKNSRIAVLFCGTMIILCIFIVVFRGLGELQDARDDVVLGLQQSKGLAEDAIYLIDNVTMLQEQSSAAVENITSDTESLCPEFQEACVTTECDNETAAIVEQMRDFFEETNSFVYNETQGVREDVVKLVNDFEDYEQTADEFDIVLKVAIAFNVLLGVVTLVIMLDVVLVWTKTSSLNCWLKTFRCIRHWLFVPVFILLVFLCWIFSMVFVLGSIATADVCLETPDDTIVTVLEENKDNFSSLIFNFAVYNVGGCEGEGPLGFRNALERIYSAGRSAFVFATAVETADSVILEQICGDDAEAVALAAMAAQRILCVLGSAMHDVQDYFACRNWRPVYRTVMHNAVCDSGTRGLYAIAITQFVIVVLAMVMLTLRAAIYLIDNVTMLQEQSSAAVENITSDTESLCPEFQEACVTTECDNETAAIVEQMRDFFEETNSFVYNETQGVREDVVKLVNDFEDYEQTADEFDIVLKVAIAFNVLLGVVTLVIMLDVVLVWTKTSSLNCWLKTFRCIRHWLFVPVFILLVFLCWIFSMVFVLGSIATADVCLETPDDTIVTVLEENKDNFSSLIFNFAVYNVGGCEGEGPLGFRNALERIYSAGRSAFVFATAVETADSVILEQICGDDAEAVALAAMAAQRILCVLGSAMHDVQDYFACRNWRPVYRTVMHNAVCDSGTRGLYAIAITQFVIVVLAMVMLTLRAAFVEDEQQERPLDSEHLENPKNDAIAVEKQAFPYDESQPQDDSRDSELKLQEEPRDSKLE